MAENSEQKKENQSVSARAEYAHKVCGTAWPVSRRPDERDERYMF
ncbi:MAG: hypothetical protein ACLP2X_24415 [Syntrophobacteraceae bacterium]